jgi:hypothetical protein
MSEVTGFGIEDFLTKSVKEILWDHQFLSDDTGCRENSGVRLHKFHYKSICKKESMLLM